MGYANPVYVKLCCSSDCFIMTSDQYRPCIFHGYERRKYSGQPYRTADGHGESRLFSAKVVLG